MYRKGPRAVSVLALLFALGASAQHVDTLPVITARQLLALDSGRYHAAESTSIVDLIEGDLREVPGEITVITAEQLFEVDTTWFTILITVLGIGASMGLFFLRRKNRMIRAQFEQIARINAELREKNADLLSSITYAQNIQRSILPSEAELREVLPESFIYFKPRDIVSGDVPFVRKKGDRLFIAAIDCTGHGVPAAMLSFMAYYNLNDIITENSGMDVGDILTELHQRINATVQGDPAKAEMRDGMDIALVEIDLVGRMLWYSGAQNPMLLVRYGVCTRIHGDKCSIGDPTGACSLGFRTHRLDLLPSDRVYLYSDGLVHQFGGPTGRRKFSTARLMRMLADMGNAPTEQLATTIAHAHLGWQEEQPQTDDIVLIGFSLAHAAATRAA